MQPKDKRPLFELEDHSLVWNVDLLLKAIKESNNSKWQLQVYYKYGYYLLYTKNCLSILSSLCTSGVFDIRTFLIHQYQQHGDYYIDNSVLYFKLSQLIVTNEINNRKVILVPEVKRLKGDVIVLPSLVDDNTYHWTIYHSYNPNKARGKYGILLSSLVGTKRKIA